MDGWCSSAQALRILVVDDNVDAAETLTVLLNHWGHTTRVIVMPSEALPAFHSFQPDVVLLDLRMPRIDGYEVARRMREQALGTQLFIFALTAYADSAHRSRATRDFDGYLVKPVDAGGLQKLLASLASENTGTLRPLSA